MEIRQRCVPLAGAAILGCTVVFARVALGEVATHDVPLFTVSKSENKNLVQYSVHEDDQCVPLSKEPVFAFWRMLEKGPNVNEHLLASEQKAYGVASQTVTERRADGGTVRLVLNAVPKRAILIETSRGADGSCRAYPRVTIDGAPAYLYNVYIRLKWLFGVDYLLLSGWSVDGTHVITEKLRD
jgi:hypothetical protein